MIVLPPRVVGLDELTYEMSLESVQHIVSAAIAMNIIICDVPMYHKLLKYILLLCPVYAALRDITKHILASHFSPGTVLQ